MKYTLITDGAYSSTRDQGGLAFVFLRDSRLILEYSKGVFHTTNNKMELGAIILGLRAIKSPIGSLEIVTDSQYCIGCAIKGWKRNKNRELWKEFDREYTRVSSLCSNIIFTHVKGHQAITDEYSKWNDYVDRLAVNASKALL